MNPPAFAALLASCLPLAHVGPASTNGPVNWSQLVQAWELDPLLLLGLVVSAWIYRRGVRRLGAELDAGHGLRGWEVAAFWAGWWTLVLALSSPLHPWGQVLFAAHMTQHELLMVGAAPLLVLGRPFLALMFALPWADARQLSRAARRPALRRTWRTLTHPVVAWAVHAAALWLWHEPVLFQATLVRPWLHDLQHLSFFGSALLFWWSALNARARLQGFGVAVLYLFTTMAHTGLLGALLTFATRPLYPDYAAGARAWGLTPLEDQQLGGLIMWVPAGFVYMIAGLALVAGWMRRADRAPTPPAVRRSPGTSAQLG